MSRARSAPRPEESARLSLWRRVGAFLAWLARPEALDPSSSARTPDASPGFLRWLSARETLPPPPPDPEEPEPTFVGWLTRSERLPDFPPAGGDAP